MLGVKRLSLSSTVGQAKNRHQEQGTSLSPERFHRLSPDKRKEDNSYHKCGWNEKKKAKTKHLVILRLE